VIGAPYVARWPVTYPYQPIKSIEAGIQKNGFAFVEILAPCPTAYGRRNKLRNIEQAWQWYREHVVLIDEYERIEKFGTLEEKQSLAGKIKVGVFQDVEKPSFTDMLEQQIESLRVKPTTHEQGQQAA